MNRRIARKVYNNFFRGIVRAELGRKAYIPKNHLFLKAYRFIHKYKTKRV